MDLTLYVLAYYMGEEKSSLDLSSLGNQIERTIKEKFGLSDELLKRVLQDLLHKLPASPNTFPVSIISKKATILESTVKFLKENRKKPLSEIAKIVGRNQRNLWQTYNKVKTKIPEAFPETPNSMQIPFEIFHTNLSPSEAVVSYLKEKQNLAFHEIADLLSRDNRTIWTIYARAKKKNEKTK
jgi:hypothetical protein